MAVGSVLAVLTIRSVLAWSTILARSTVHAVLSVLTMVNSDIAALAETDCITNHLSILIDWSDPGYIIIVLKSINDCLKRHDVGIHLIHLSLKSFKSIPGRQLDLSAVSQGDDDV